MSGRKYKLTYGKGKGLGEICRLLFAEGGVEYEDERWAPEEFQEKKQGLPFKTMPCLEVDGKKYSQSCAIARFLAREIGLMGANNMETLRIEEIEGCMLDSRQELLKIYFEKDETKRAEAKAAMVKDFLPKLFNFLEMRLKENNDGKGFFVGDKMSYADLFVFNDLDLTNVLHEVDVLESQDLLKAHRERVKAQPRIAKWLKERPVTDH